MLSYEKRVDAFVKRYGRRKVGELREELLELAGSVELAKEIADRLGVSLDAVIGTDLKDHERVVFLDRSLHGYVSEIAKTSPFLGETARTVAVFAIRKFIFENYKRISE